MYVTKTQRVVRMLPGMLKVFVRTSLNGVSRRNNVGEETLIPKISGVNSSLSTYVL